MSGFENGCQNKGEEDADGFQNSGIGGDVINHAGNSNNLAQNTAGCGYEQNGADSFQSVIGQVIEFVNFIGS